MTNRRPVADALAAAIAHARAQGHSPRAISLKAGLAQSRVREIEAGADPRLSSVDSLLIALADMGAPVIIDTQETRE